MLKACAAVRGLIHDNWAAYDARLEHVFWKPSGLPNPDMAAGTGKLLQTAMLKAGPRSGMLACRVEG